jgi:small subunit ribosomal protein S10
MLSSKILKFDFKLKSFHPYYLNNFLVRLRKKLNNSIDITIKHTFLPRRYERFTLLKSPHVDKKARDQYERTTHKRLLTIYINMSKNIESNENSLNSLLSIIQKTAVGLDVSLIGTNVVIRS